MDKESDESAVSQQTDSSPQQADPADRQTGQTGQETGQDSQQAPAPSGSFIPPSPMPVKADVKSMEWGDEVIVFITMVTPAGMTYYFLNADGAHQFGRAVMGAARDAQAATAAPKLTVVKKGGLIRP